MFVIVNGALQFVDDSGLTHHGVKGMKWGVRRYQNPDGSLTPAGQKRYAKKIANSYNAQVRRDGGRRLPAFKKLSKSDAIDSLYNNEELRSARQKLKALDKEEDDYYRDPVLVEKHQRVYAEEVSKDFGVGFDRALSWVQESDANRYGAYTSFPTYLESIGRSDSYYQERRSARQLVYDTGKKIADAYLGEYGNTPIRSLRGVTDLSGLMAEALDERYSRELLADMRGRRHGGE